VLAWNQRTRREPKREQHSLFKRLGKFLTNRLDVGALLTELALQQPRNSQSMPLGRNQIHKTNAARLLSFTTKKPQRKTGGPSR
jgi:hypothetical protein